MRTALALALALALTACGDDTPAPDAGSPKVEAPGGFPPELLENARKRMREKMAKGPRMPGMPHGDNPVDTKAAAEAMKRAFDAQGLDDAKIKTFLAVVSDLKEGKASAIEVYTRHSMSALEYSRIAALFGRYEAEKRMGGPAAGLPALTEKEKALAERWHAKWLALRK